MRSAADLKDGIQGDSRCPATARSRTLAGPPSTEGVVAVNTLKFWARPAVLVALWIVAAAFTLSQLTTVARLLLSTRQRPPLVAQQRDPSA
jgi:hypothetical protein